MSWKRWHAVLVGCVVASFTAPASASSISIPIESMKMRVGDDAAWAAPTLDDRNWANVRSHEVDSQKRLLWLRAPVKIRIADFPGPILGVHIGALASYEIYWNGQLIGRSGTPANSAAAETPGLVDGHFPIPAGQVRNGINMLAVRMSSFHLPARVTSPLQRLSVGDYGAGATATMKQYALAITAAGAMLLGALYFAAAYAVDRTRRGALLLALLSITLLMSLTLEAVRGFVSYRYDLHLWRMWSIFLLASVFGLLLVAYVRQQFLARGGRWPIWLALCLCAASYAVLPGLDTKVAGALLGSAGIASVILIRPAARMEKAAVLAILGCGLMFISFAIRGGDFLNQDFYLIATAVLAVFFFHRGLVQPVDAAELPVGVVREHDRLTVMSARGVELIDLSMIVAIQGADDYAEVRSMAGTTRLYRGRLNALEKKLPHNFMRVHRSHIINTDHARQFICTNGSPHILLASDVVVPVSRSHSSKVRNWFEGPSGEQLPRPVLARLAENRQV